MASRKAFQISILVIFAIAIIVLLSGCTSPSTSPVASPTPTAAPQQTMMLVTTTSMQDSGLLDYILPAFESANNVNVKVVAKGSGDALALGQSGDADVLIVHSPAAEQTFMNGSYGWNRTQFAYNYFVIVGPASDPAGIKGLNAASAFRKIYDNKSIFVSRGDTSGTANKEKDLWNKSGYAQPNNTTTAWYKSTGSGMLDTLRMADQFQGYTLSDKATFLKNEKNMSLVILVDNTTDMINKYDVIAINQTMHPSVNYDLAKKFIAYLTSNETQANIGEYGKSTVGQPLFFPQIVVY
jgi:tungstate transport system substrate-binding protein